MTSAELANELKVSVAVVKKMLRARFSDEDFRPPDKQLTATHERAVRDGLDSHRRERREAVGDADSPVLAAWEPESVASIRPVTLEATHEPRPRTGHRLWVHRDLFDYLVDDGGDTRRQREHVKRIMREALVEGRPARRVKHTRGVNAGWLRAPLGDNGGKHYYLWLALPGRRQVGALGLAAGDVVLRVVRHHDDVAELHAGAAGEYTLMDAQQYVSTFEQTLDLRAADPLSSTQRAAHEHPTPISITQGHPGSGKTTLQLERTRRLSGDLLFVTFGAAQRERAERWLATYAPGDVRYTASTQEQLFQMLDSAWRPAARAERAIERLERVVESMRRELGPWRTHTEALYDELRAHYWGRALPFSIRERPAVTTDADRERAYRALRGPVLGPAAVEGAVRAARALEADDRAALFGDLEQLASYLVRLDGGAPLPAELAQLHAIFIDEIQDLTLIETSVCVFLARAVTRERGFRPIFHVAGDEGQTVRPTDFDWGELKDLVNRFLGPPVEFKLPGNVRSPRTMTQVVNNSWSLYQAVDRSHRPRGDAHAAAEESALGCVMWAETGADLSAALRVVGDTPGAVLVYPGPHVPDDVRVAAAAAGVLHTFAAPEVKGLDYRTVFVLDAGRRAAEVFAASARSGEETIVQIESRAACDSIRVAISRATEVLVFLERKLEGRTRERLALLCGKDGELLDGVVPDVPIADLVGHLDLDTSDRTALVTEALADFDQTFADDPSTGLRIAERARGWLGDAGRAAAVQGELRKHVYRASGRALLRVATLPTTPAGERAAMLGRANRDFNLAGETDAARLCLDARTALDPGADGAPRAIVSVAQIAAGADSLSRDDARAVLVRFFDESAARTSSLDAKGWGRILDVIQLLDERGGGAALNGADRRIVRAAVEWAVAQRPTQASTQLASRSIRLWPAAPPHLRAAVAERDPSIGDPIVLYREAGDFTSALRVSRARGDDPVRSLELARAAEDPARVTIERLAHLEHELAALAVGELTDAERTRLLASVRARLAR